MSPYILRVRNVNEALSAGLRLLNGSGVAKEPSRNGDVRAWPGPVITLTLAPRERVLFSPMRNANPFFHLFESLWMLAGRNDLPFIAQFNQQMTIYSDDGGKTQPAAYGHRWRNHFGYDQLKAIADELKSNPGTRRAVLTMWDNGDLHNAVSGSADVPCNTQCFFTIRDGKLDMAVTCRSNDVLWGAHGANAVHFSILQEYLAAHVGVELGEMLQFSWNYHLYDDVLKEDPLLVAQDCLDHNYYAQHGAGVACTPMFDDVASFDKEVGPFCDWLAEPGWHDRPSPVLTNRFLGRVARPMAWAWAGHKNKNYAGARAFASVVEDSDWRVASHEWVRHRQGAWERKQKEKNDG